MLSVAHDEHIECDGFFKRLLEHGMKTTDKYSARYEHICKMYL